MFESENLRKPIHQNSKPIQIHPVDFGFKDKKKYYPAKKNRFQSSFSIMKISFNYFSSFSIGTFTNWVSRIQQITMPNQQSSKLIQIYSVDFGFQDKKYYPGKKSIERELFKSEYSKMQIHDLRFNQFLIILIGYFHHCNLPSTGLTKNIEKISSEYTNWQKIKIPHNCSNF